MQAQWSLQSSSQWSLQWSLAPTLSDVGERALLRAIAQIIGPPRSPVIIGIGDDSAVLAAHGSVVISTDMAVEDRHFRTGWITPYDLGRRIIVQNAADIAAMGAMPHGYTIGCGAPASMSAKAVEDLMRGCRDQAAHYDGQILVVELVVSDKITLSVTAIGILPPNQLAITLAGSRVGDEIAVSAPLGGSAAGLAALHAASYLGGGIAMEFAELVGNFRVPRGLGDDLAALVAQARTATALTDLSDGLMRDAVTMAEAAGVSFHISPDRLPFPESSPALAEHLGENLLTWTLGGGEDHALLGTFRAGEVPPGWFAIGSVEKAGDEPVVAIGSEGAEFAGWDSLR